MGKRNQLSNEELATFCAQMGTLIKAGITPIESLRILYSDTNDKESRALIMAILDSIAAGSTFAEALASVKVFPEYVVNTIKLGEESGTPDEVLSSLAEYYDRENQISENIKSAITYPFIMIFMMFVVIIILITKVLPIFNQVFVQLGAEMTGFGASLMRFGSNLNAFSIVVVSILVLCVATYLFLSKTEKGRKVFKRILASFALTKGFYEDISIGRFASGLAFTYTAGLDTFSSLDMVRNIVEHEKIREKIDVCKLAILDGDNLAEALKKAAIFSNVDNRMISVGIRTGEIENIMRHIADSYERKSEKKMNDIISVIEPTLVIILSVIVGLILLSVILPLMGIMSSIG